MAHKHTTDDITKLLRGLTTSFKRSDTVRHMSVLAIDPDVLQDLEDKMLEGIDELEEEDLQQLEKLASAKTIDIGG